jgi:hypothetical protein
MVGYSKESLRNYIEIISTPNRYITPEPVGYEHGGTFVDIAFYGGVYSPLEQRIYLVPYAIAPEPNWYYIDCVTGLVMPYTAGVGAVLQAYKGGVYSPTQKRIYLCPYYQSDQLNWHYIDCVTGTAISYLHNLATLPVSIAYYGGAYLPTLNRIYFAPYNQTFELNWHYIDCVTGTVMTYPTGSGAMNVGAYSGAVYSPDQERIYFCPNTQVNETLWHYINGSTGLSETYAGVATAPCDGGVYSPMEDRIYFISSNTPSSDWVYIDCATGTAVQYIHGSPAVADAHAGGCYSPITNRIYFTPYGQSTNPDWIYIDCFDGIVKTYTHVGASPINQAQRGAVYCPELGRVYFIPYLGTDTETTWFYIDEMSAPVASKSLMAGPMFNKY